MFYYVFEIAGFFSEECFLLGIDVGNCRVGVIPNTVIDFVITGVPFDLFYTWKVFFEGSFGTMSAFLIRTIIIAIVALRE
jgi:hypothetical protein